MRTRSRNDQEKSERREHLLNSAQEMFFKKGFENTSIDDIAKKADVSRALVYFYFKGKKGIYRSLRIRSVVSLFDRMHKHVCQNDLGIKQVKQAGEAFYEFYKQDKKHFDCLSLDIGLNNQNAKLKKEAKEDPESLEIERKIMQVMINAIETGLKDGSIASEKVPSALETAMFLRGSLHGVILLQDQDGSSLLDQSNIDKHAMMIYAINQVTSSLKPDSTQ